MELRDRIALTLLPGVGPVLSARFLEKFGSASAFFSAEPRVIRQLPLVGAQLTDAVMTGARRQADDELEKMQKLNIRALVPGDPEYPDLLTLTPDAPGVLYIKGELSAITRPVAVVGTRKPTPYGLEQTNRLVEAWAPMGISVISGLAYGIDKTAHQAALDNHLTTIAVVAHGLDQIYPPGHRSLTNKILEAGGALISEFRIGQLPDRENFPKRNRLIAGVSWATVVMEAADKGGALITARLAHGYGRDVFALPGRVNDPWSAGCLNLIREQVAYPLTRPEDLGDELGWTRQRSEKMLPLFFPENPVQEKLEVLLKRQVMHIDDLCSSLQLPVYQLHPELTKLEIGGWITSLPGKRFQWNPA